MVDTKFDGFFGVGGRWIWIIILAVLFLCCFCGGDGFF